MIGDLDGPDGQARRAASGDERDKVSVNLRTLPPVDTTRAVEGAGACTHCGGEGVFWPTPDPLSHYPDDPDAPDECYACGGSGRREDQTIF